MFILWLTVMGTNGWLEVVMLWHDKALIMLNGALILVLVMGLMKAYLI